MKRHATTTANSGNRRPKSVTIGEYVHFLTRIEITKYQPRWPPDAFAIAAGLLSKSGAYCNVVNKWPPSKYAKNWTKVAERTGDKWKAACASTKTKLPANLLAAWKVVQKNKTSAIDRIKLKVDLFEALVLILATADEACGGVGIVGEKPDNFYLKSFLTLLRKRNDSDISSLCQAIHPSRAVVLPKLHTPSSGISIRSLSHNLAFWDDCEVTPRWQILPSDIRENEHGLNLLLIPWPFEIAPSAFQPCKGHLKNIPTDFGFFDYIPPTAQSRLSQVIKSCVINAERLVGKIHGIILPELAMAEKEFNRIAREHRRRLLIAGIKSRSEVTAGTFPTNQVALKVPSFDFVGRQTKHHRWLLERAQIRQYGLGGTLDENVRWWEATEIGARGLNFWNVNAWLTLCVLICEDLARQDPVSSLVRAVGPNLVICLLLDGPQLTPRWSARYATVLADDPRSSVLTLTSAGMIKLSYEQGKGGPLIVGLWKDALSGPAKEICLESDSSGVVLSLNRQLTKEWSADGRHDYTGTGYLCLSGIHQVRLKSKRVSPRRGRE